MRLKISSKYSGVSVIYNSALGSDGSWGSFRFTFCKEYSLIYFRSQMSVTQEVSRICSFYFIFDFAYGWRSSTCVFISLAAYVLYHSNAGWITSAWESYSKHSARHYVSTLPFKPICESLRYVCAFLLVLHYTNTLSVLAYWRCLWHIG